MDKQKLISFLFDFAGMDLDKLLEGLGIDEKLERQKIQNVANDFEKYILERHGENPSYEDIAKFWKENQVSEELIKIRYNWNSKYKDYEEFKNHLKTMISSQDFDHVLFFGWMNLKNVCLIRYVIFQHSQNLMLRNIKNCMRILGMKSLVCQNKVASNIKNF